MRMTMARVLAVSAAALLVAAVAIATLGPTEMTLGELLAMWGADPPSAAPGFLGGFAWNNLIVPLLVRPDWLLPAAMGLICAGIAATLSTPPDAPQSHHRRS